CNTRKMLHGHPGQKRMLPWNAIVSTIPVAVEYVRQNPPPADVVAALQRIIGPGADFRVVSRPEWWQRKPQVESDARGRLVAYFCWWRDPESKHTHQGKYRSRARTLTSEYVLAVLLALEVYITERTWGRGHAPEYQRALTLIGMRTRQRRVRITSIMRRILAHVISEQIGFYLISNTQLIIERSSELQLAATERVQRTHATLAALAYRAKRFPAKKRNTSMTDDDWRKSPPSLVVNPRPISAEERARWLKELFPKC